MKRFVFCSLLIGLLVTAQSFAAGGLVKDPTGVAALMIPYQYLDKLFLSHLHTDHMGDIDALWAVSFRSSISIGGGRALCGF